MCHEHKAITVMLLCPAGVAGGSGAQVWGFQGSVLFSGHGSGAPQDMNDIEGLKCVQ